MGLIGAVQRGGDGPLGIEPALAGLDIQTVLHHVGGGGEASRALAVEALAAQLGGLVGDEVEVGGDGGLQVVGVHQGGLDVGADAVFRRAGVGQQLAHEAVGPEVGDVLGGDIADAEGGDGFLRQHPTEGNVGGDGQLAADVVAVDVGAGVGLGVAQGLGLLQHGGEVHVAAVHGVHDIVAGAVHDAAQGLDLIQAGHTLQIHQPGDAAAHRRRAAQGHALFRRQGGELPVIGGDEGLVGSDHVLARFQGGLDVLVGRVETAHHLHHRVDGIIAQNILDVTGGNGGNLRLVRAHQNALHRHVAAAQAPLMHAAAYHAISQKAKLHIAPPQKRICLIVLA